LYFCADDYHWIRPTTLKDVQELKSILSKHVAANQIKLVVGNTATGIYPDEKPRFIIDISQIKELNELTEKGDGIFLGAAVPIQDLMELCERVIKQKPADTTAGLRQLAHHAKYIAGIQVRNAGSVAGNIFITKAHSKTGVPFPSDMFTVLASLGSTVTIWSATYEKNQRTFPLTEMPIAEEMPGDAMLLSFHIPFTRTKEFVHTYRIARRPQMAHPIVNAGFRCLIDDEGKIAAMSVVYGGLATCNGKLPQLEQSLKGKPWTEETLKGALEQLKKEVREIIVPMEEEGFTNEYRSQLAEGFFYKFYLYVTKQLTPKAIGALNESAAEEPTRPLSTGMQSYEIDDVLLPLTSPIARRTAISQATGEVKYTHDLSLPAGGYHGVVVTSTHAHARFTFSAGLKATEELLGKEFTGFRGLITVADVPEKGTN
ncbi:MAG: FAD binding domain-containing protein, partial [Terriglobales bacterium]